MTGRVRVPGVSVLKAGLEKPHVTLTQHGKHGFLRPLNYGENVTVLFSIMVHNSSISITKRIKIIPKDILFFFPSNDLNTVFFLPISNKPSG